VGEGSFDGLHFRPAPAVSGEIPGARSVEMLAEQRRLESSALAYPRELPVAVAEGRGATIRDVDGNTFVDFFSGAGALNLGHGHPVVARAAERQQARLIHMLDFPTEPRLDLMRRLKPLLPGSLARRGRFHFGGPTGSDAIEASLKLVRQHTDRDTVVAFTGSYHGVTEGARSVTGAGRGGRDRCGSVHFTPYAYCYRCPLNLKPRDCGLACADLLDDSLSSPASGIGEVAGVVVEPLQGEGGTIVPPRGWLLRVQEITRRHQVPLIADEVQTGFGRTGELFACGHDEITPDVLVVSKALGGIGFPLSAIAFDEDLDGWRPGSHIGTFRGHQVAMAAGAAAIGEIVERDLSARARQLGEVALTRLRDGTEGLPAVGDIRGLGLMIGVELVRDARTREPWPDLARQLRRACLSNGLLVEVGGHYDNVVRFLPPLVITRELFERGVEIFLDSLLSLQTPATWQRKKAV
jgi:diaminobutyrate-2-oxoglutarate transaminase